MCRTLKIILQHKVKMKKHENEKEEEKVPYYFYGHKNRCNLEAWTDQY